MPSAHNGAVIHMLLTVATATALPPRVDSVAIVVRDLAAEIRFYTRTLGFRRLGISSVRDARVAHLALGRERVDLVRYARDGATIPASAKSDDRTFQHVAIIVSDMRRAWNRVARAGIARVSVAPQVLPRSNPAAGGIAAVYFRDPEGHPLELLHFPPGKGAPQWHAATPLFLGIDHTAIAVADVPASMRFYERLGLAVRGRSDNVGIEQARLSGVPGAHVAITALRFAGAPGVEFLHYLHPMRTQPPERARPNDLLATRTRIVEPGAAALCAASAPIARAGGGCLLRDPDGHLVEIASP